MGFEHQLQEFASIIDLQIEHYWATLKIMERHHNEAKKFLCDPPM